MKRRGKWEIAEKARWHDCHIRKSGSDPAGNRTIVTLLMLPEADSRRRLTTAGHTHLHVLLGPLPRWQKSPLPVLLWHIPGESFNIFGPVYWSVEGVSATVFRKALLQSRSCPGSVFEGVIRQASMCKGVGVGILARPLCFFMLYWGHIDTSRSFGARLTAPLVNGLRLGGAPNTGIPLVFEVSAPGCAERCSAEQLAASSGCYFPRSSTHATILPTVVRTFEDDEQLEWTCSLTFYVRRRRLRASHLGKPGSVPGRITPGFSQVVGGFSRGSPVSATFSFRRCFIHPSFHHHRLSRPQVVGPYKLDFAYLRLGSLYEDLLRAIAVGMVLASPVGKDYGVVIRGWWVRCERGRGERNKKVVRRMGQAAEGAVYQPVGRPDWGRVSDCGEPPLGLTIITLASHQGEPVFNTRPGHRIFASGNHAGRCRWSAGFLGDLPFPPPLHSGAAPYYFNSPSSALKTSPNYDRVKRCRERKINIKASERVIVDFSRKNKRPCPPTQANLWGLALARRSTLKRSFKSAQFTTNSLYGGKHTLMPRNSSCTRLQNGGTCLRYVGASFANQRLVIYLPETPAADQIMGTCASKETPRSSASLFIHTVFDTSWRTVAQSSPSTLTAHAQCAVDIGTFVHKTTCSVISTNVNECVLSRKARQGDRGQPDCKAARASLAVLWSVVPARLAVERWGRYAHSIRIGEVLRWRKLSRNLHIALPKANPSPERCVLGILFPLLTIVKFLPLKQDSEEWVDKATSLPAPPPTTSTPRKSYVSWDGDVWKESFKSPPCACRHPLPSTPHMRDMPRGLEPKPTLQPLLQKLSSPKIDYSDVFLQKIQGRVILKPCGQYQVMDNEEMSVCGERAKCRSRELMKVK
ncbi:hypothetical protein PR048_031348 [Dryococelus australis]|uniref:Uncharacterized protein n=1 Tax=Dryococelus australis TaxID=614101 RepID=A0ABQ9G509_9NEOP|nr:hypothetical protein PR048_031348 [Dryococelus australis]